MKTIALNRKYRIVSYSKDAINGYYKIQKYSNGNYQDIPGCNFYHVDHAKNIFNELSKKIESRKVSRELRILVLLSTKWPFILKFKIYKDPIFTKNREGGQHHT